MPNLSNKIDILREQLKIFRKIQEEGYNIVTCGECGNTMLHLDIDTVITCPNCNYTGEICDFPDLYY